MTRETIGADSETQQQQGDKPDLKQQYRAIGIQAVSATTLFKGKAKAPAQQQAQIVDFED